MVEDDLSPILKKPFIEVVEGLEQLLSQNSKAVLLGAGCSFCAGLPLTAQLTQSILESKTLTSESKSILEEIRDNFSGAQPAAHIEDFLSELVDWLAISSRRARRNTTESSVTIKKTKYNESILKDAIEQIKLAIAEQIDRSVDISMHLRFVMALHQNMRPGKAGFNQPVDYLVMNYDTLIEDALALSKTPYSDGMAGGVTGWWEPSTFDYNNLDARVYKLHGSINWQELPDSAIPHRVSTYVKANSVDNKRILIWPASTKYRETQLDPYAQLMARARSIFNPMQGAQRVLLIAGYSFGDSHINLEIERGLKASRGNLTIIAFISDDEPTCDLNKWHKDPEIKDQVLIFANKGFFHGDDIRKSSHENLLWWKFEHITKILEGSLCAR
jgi:hypothetical protein